MEIKVRLVSRRDKKKNSALNSICKKVCLINIHILTIGKVDKIYSANRHYSKFGGKERNQ